MKEIALWLRNVEHLAGSFYREAAGAFSQDPPLQSFLQHLAEEEAWHFHVMGSALAEIDRRPDLISAIIVDDATVERIEGPFRDNSIKLAAGTLDRDDLYDCIVAAEFSEWNEVYLYVVGSLKEVNREFLYAASKMEYHKKHILKYFDSLPEGERHREKLRSLPKVSDTSILIVDDNDAIRYFLEAVLSSEGSVDTAKNGQEALMKVRGKFYDLILSDIQMPVMNGIELFKEAVREDSRIGERLFFLPETLPESMSTSSTSEV